MINITIWLISCVKIFSSRRDTTVLVMNKKNKGFTLTETLLTITILVILFALAVPGVFTIKKNLRQMELDDKAEIIYTAVQNRLSELYTSGLSYYYDPSDKDAIVKLGKVPGDYDSSVNGDTMNENSVYYFTSLNANDVKDFLGSNTIDSSLNGHYVIEYMPYAKYEAGETPQLSVPFVYAVYYSEDVVDVSVDYKTNEKLYLNTYRYKNNRLKADARVGYYGGSTPGSGSITTVSSINYVNIFSEEEINTAVVKGRINADDVATSSFEFVFEDQHKNTFKYIYDSSISQLFYLDNEKKIAANKELADVSIVGTNYTFTFVVDKLSKESTRFTNIFTNLIPGDDISLTAVVKNSNGNVINDTRKAVGNGIYAYVKNKDEYTNYKTNTAYISNGRHLQNLDASSGVAKEYNNALLINDIDLSTNSKFYEAYKSPSRGNNYINSYVDVYKISGGGLVNTHTVPCFKGIVNDRLNVLDGNYYSIKELSVRSGLFNSVSNNLSILNLSLTGEKVYGNSSNAGGFIGSINNGANVNIRRCQNYLVSNEDIPTSIDSEYKLEALRWIYSKNISGGLVGLNAGTLNVESSFVATNIGLSKIDTVTGGLVGKNTGVINIDKSYADCYFYGNTVGGLIGESTNSSVQISNSYTAGFIGTDGKTGVSLAGFVPSKINKISNSYTVIVKALLDDSRTNKGFMGIKNFNDSVSDTSIYYATVKGANSYNNLYYSKPGSNDEATIGNPYSEQSSILGDAFDFSGKSKPYKLMGTSLTSYNYHKLKGIDHYGDWGATFATGSLVYYEKYGDDTYGFEGANVDISLTSKKEIKGDGYGIVFKKDEINAGTFTVNGSTFNFNTSKNFYVEKNGITYIVYPLSREEMNPNSAVNNYYEKCEIVVNGNKNTKKVFYFNPHFGRTVIESDTLPVLPSTVCIRSPRQLYNLSLYYKDYKLGDYALYKQERKMDYAYYDWTNFGKNGKEIWEQNPIGDNLKDPFVGTYDGGSYEIVNVDFVTKNGDYIGLFGYNKGNIKNTVVTTQYKIGGDSYHVSRIDPITANQKAYFGVLVGYNDGIIENSAIAGYYLSGDDGKIHGYRNSEIYIGGLVGYNKGKIINSASDLPKLSLIMNTATCYAGSFVGYNEGSIDNTYGISMIESDANDGDTKIAGFAGYNVGSISNSYCATTLTANGEGVKTYSFTPASGGGTIKNSYYLFGGSYLYLNDLFAYEGGGSLSSALPKLYQELVSLKGKNEASVSKYNKLTTDLDSNEVNYPYKAIVKDVNTGNLVHYGEWQVKPKLGVVGVFYWEHEEHGQNVGYKITYIGSSYDKVAYKTNLCNEHNDGSVITEYGYGYYYGVDTDVSKELKTFNNLKVSKSINEAAKKALERQMPHIQFFPYTTRKLDYDNGDDFIYLDNDNGPNGTISLTLDSKNYNFTISPFFANAMSFDGSNLTSDDSDASRYLDNVPGYENNCYEIRSADQLQYINWNKEEKTAKNLVNPSNYMNFTYLMHTTITGKGKQGINNAGNKDATNYVFKQTHDLNANNIDNFVPISGQSTTSTNGYNAILYTWFGGTYDGQSYKIQELNIDSKSFTVGLFGVTVGANVKNTILYSTKNAVIKRSTSNTDQAGAYALGGLVGIAYGYSNNDDNKPIENCAIAGYKIIDDSKNKLTLGEVNVGGLIGVSNINVDKCSAVVDIEINCKHEGTKGNFTQADWGNFIRVGGISGAVQYTVTNSYSGGSISVGDDVLKETYSSSNLKYDDVVSTNSNNKASVINSTHIYLAGIAGSGFTMNYQNFTGEASLKDGNPYIENCYTYMQFPALEGTIRSITMMTSAADRYAFDTVKVLIKNCYYLDRSANFDLSKRPKYCFIDTNNSYRYMSKWDSNKINDMILGYANPVSNYLSNKNANSSINNNSGSLVYNNISKTFAEMKNPSFTNALGLAYSNVTLKDDYGVVVDGKYSFNAGNSALNGKNYPFPTVITQDNNTINVHYGIWPTESAYFENGSDSIDIFNDMTADKYAYKEFILKKGTSKTLNNLTFTVVKEDGDEDYAELVRIDGNNFYSIDSNGDYHIKIKALKTGSTVVNAQWKDADDNSFSTNFNLVVTANLFLEASPSMVYANRDEKVVYKLGYDDKQNYLEAKSSNNSSYSKDVTWSFTSSKIGSGIEEEDAVKPSKFKNELNITSYGYNGVLSCTAEYDYHGNVYSASVNINILNNYIFGLHGNKYHEMLINGSEIKLSEPSYGTTTGPKNEESNYFIYERNDDNDAINRDLIQSITKDNILLSPFDDATDETKGIIENNVNIVLSDKTDTNSINNNDYNSKAISLIYKGGTLETFDCNLSVNVNGTTLIVPVTLNLIPYKLILDANGGTVNNQTKQFVNLSGTENINLSDYDVTRTGYDFDGWYKDDGNKYDLNIYPVLGATDDVTLTAHWNVLSGTIRLDNGLSGENNKSEVKECEYNTNSVNLPSFENTSYSLAGYYDDAGNLILRSDGTVENKGLFNQYLLANIDNNEDIKTLTAKWVKNVIITLNSFDDSGKKPPTTISYKKGSIINKIDAEKMPTYNANPIYTFDGFVNDLNVLVIDKDGNFVDSNGNFINYVVDTDLSLTAIFKVSGFKKVNSFKDGSDYLVVSNNKVMSNDTLNGIEFGFMKDINDDEFILNNSSNLSWTYTKNSLYSNTKNQYLYGRYSRDWQLNYTYYLEFHNEANTWSYNENTLNTKFNYSYFNSKNLYVYLNESNKFVCDDKNHNNIDIYEKTNVTVKYYEPISIGGIE